MAATVAVSACESSDPNDVNFILSKDARFLQLMDPPHQDRLKEWSSGVPLEKNHPFANSLGIDVSTMTLPDPTLMIVKQAEVVAPYGTKCVVVFTREDVSDNSRISGWISYRSKGPWFTEGFGNWGINVIPGWLKDHEADCN